MLPGAPGTGLDSRGFAFAFQRGGDVRKEENGQNVDWNVNWGFSDGKSRIIPYSSSFICSIR